MSEPLVSVRKVTSQTTAAAREAGIHERNKIVLQERNKNKSYKTVKMKGRLMIFFLLIKGQIFLELIG